MIVIILEKPLPSLKGELTRWLLEPKANVFVGRVSAEVRKRLWEKVIKELPQHSGALLIHQSDDEHGFRITFHGETTRRVVELEGLQLIQREPSNFKDHMKKLRAKPPEGIIREFDWRNPPGVSPTSNEGKKALEPKSPDYYKRLSEQRKGSSPDET